VQHGGERKLVTVLFADLTGYTSLTERLDPEDVYTFLRPGMAALVAVVEEHGGTVPQIHGDGFMAVFGVPVTHEDDAERAVHAALALREQVVSLNAAGHDPPFPPVHTGVASGEVMVAPHWEASGFQVVGDAVNTSARLSASAPAGRIFVDTLTRDRCVRSVSFGPRRSRRLRGKREPVATYEPLGTRTPKAVAHAPGTGGGFVDRDRLMAALGRELDAAVASRRSRTVWISGEPGIGKSRLAVEFGRRAGAKVLMGRAVPYGRRLPLHAIAEAVAAEADVALDAAAHDLGDAADRLASGLRRGPAARSLAADLRTLFGVASQGSRPSAGVEDAARAARRVVEALATIPPVLVVLDDMQWTDPDLASLLDELQRTPWDGAILLLALGRPERSLPAASRLTVDALNRSSMHSLAAQVLGAAPPERALAASLERAGGNPLFLEESLGMLVEERTIVPTGDGWQVAAPGPVPAVPASIRSLIAARLDGMPAGEKRLLQLVAVCGERAPAELATHLAGDATGVRVLRRLLARGLLRRDRSNRSGSGYRFRHGLIRDVAYASLPRAERAIRHAEVGSWYASGDPSLEALTAAAHHVELAWRLGSTRVGKPDRELGRLAVEHLGRLADHVRGYQARSAEEAYARALGIARQVGETDTVRARLLAGRAECLVEMGRHAEAAQDAREARRRAERAGDDQGTAWALLALGRCESDLGRTRQARATLGRARALFASAGDLRGEGWSLHRLSETWEWRDYGRELDDLRNAYRSFVRAKDRWGRAVVAQDLAFLLTLSGGREYEKWLGVARELAEDEGDLRAAADLLRTQGYHASYRGSFAEAQRTMAEARPLAAEAGDRYAEADTLMIGALASTAAGSPQDAETKASEALALAAELGSVRVRVGALHAAARAALRRGDRSRATARLRAAAQAVRRHRITTMTGETAMIEAWVALDRGAWDAVAPAARRLANQARANGWRLWEPVAPLFVGRAQLGAGRASRAIASLEKAVDLGARVGADGTGALARAFLAQATILAGRPTTIPRVSLDEPEVAAALDEARGLAALAGGHADRASERFGHAAGTRAYIGASAWLARAHALHAIALRKAGRRREAATAERRAARAFQEVGVPAAARRALIHPLDGTALDH